MTIRIQCPSCQTVFKCSSEKEGKRVTCPDCNERVVAEAMDADVTAVSSRPMAAAPRRRDLDDDDDAPRRSPKKQAGAGGLLLAVGVVGGLALVALLLIGGGGAAIFFFRAQAIAPPVMVVAGVDEEVAPAKPVIIADANAKPPAQKFNLDETRKSVVFLRVFAPGSPPSSGSGFFVTQDGLIATNRHVVETEDGVPAGATIIVGVPRSDQPDDFDYYRAELAYSTPRNDPTDFALVKIKAGPKSAPFRALPLIAKDTVALGIEVAALGYPFAAGDNANISFTKGSISSTKVAFDGKSFYQTDAAVNPGNSGGPLLNTNGEVVGIVTLRRANADNVGYALYLGETNLRNLPVENFAQLKPAPGPLGPNDRPTLRTVAAKRDNWNLERGQAKEMKSSVLLHGDTAASSFWATNLGALPANFQVSFVTVIVSPDAAEKGGKAGGIPGFPSIGPPFGPGGFPRSKGPKGPFGPPGFNPGVGSGAPALLAIRLMAAPTNNDIITGDGLTFLQSTQKVEARANRQNAGQSPVPDADGVFVVTLLKSGNTVGYFVNGKEQMRVNLPAGVQGDLLMSVGGVRGAVVLTDLYVVQHAAPVDLGAAPGVGQPIGKNDPVRPPLNKNVAVDLGGADGATRIQGGAFDPQFKDEAPDGGLLIGLELGVVNNNSIKAIRPVYRLGDVESKGKQFGRNVGNVVQLGAKSGYAVGSITVHAGLWIDGINVTFMRVKDGRLDPNDSYQSGFYGGDGGARTILGGGGSPVIGIVGKANANDCTGIGLLMKKN